MVALADWTGDMPSQKRYWSRRRHIDGKATKAVPLVALSVVFTLSGCSWLNDFTDARLEEPQSTVESLISDDSTPEAAVQSLYNTCVDSQDQLESCSMARWEAVPDLEDIGVPDKGADTAIFYESSDAPEQVVLYCVGSASNWQAHTLRVNRGEGDHWVVTGHEGPGLDSRCDFWK